jgi:hypothetical protein
MLGQLSGSLYFFHYEFAESHKPVVIQICFVVDAHEIKGRSVSHHLARQCATPVAKYEHSIPEVGIDLTVPFRFGGINQQVVRRNASRFQFHGDTRNQVGGLRPRLVDYEICLEGTVSPRNVSSLAALDCQLATAIYPERIVKIAMSSYGYVGRQKACQSLSQGCG